MDNNKIKSSDDEFHFSEAEETKSDLYNLSSDDYSGNKPNKITRRKVFIAIGIIVVTLSLYKLVSVFLGSSSAKKTSVPVATSTPPIEQSPIQVEPPQSNPMTTNLESQLSQMQQNNAAATEQMSKVFDQVNTLNNSVGNLANQVNTVNQQLQNLGTQLQSQQTTINALKGKRKVKSAFVHRPSRPKLPIWYVQAIVPGRAWLIRSNGQTTTVSKGDFLAGYGRIVWVSAVQGLVKTSTGAILRFRDL